MDRRTHTSPGLATASERASRATRRMAWVKLAGSLLMFLLIIVTAALVWL